MTLQSLALVFAIGMLSASVLFVAFGQITVRKLRRNPETKRQLGLEFASGHDILNVAQALSLPRSWARGLSRSPLFALHADPEALYRNTTRLDRCLARTFYWMLMASAFPMLVLVLIDLVS